MPRQIRSYAVASIIPDNPDAMLPRKATTEALTAAGCPVAACRGAGGGAVVRRLRLTMVRQKRFLKALAQTGSVTKAVEIAGTS